MSKPSTMRRPWMARSISLVVLSGVVAGCNARPAEDADTTSQRPAAFKVSPDQRKKLTILTTVRESFRPTLEVTGTVAFNGDRSTQVLSSVSGPVSRLAVTLGQTVTAGQPLAFVKSPDFAAAVATYRKADAASRNAQRILRLDEQLFQNDALARSDLEQARTDAASAAADVEAAALALRALGLDDAMLTAIRDGKQAAPVEGAIRATLPGVVVEQLITTGQLMSGGSTPAFTVADLSTMWVIASVYGADVSLVGAGQTADVFVDGASTPVRARVTYVAPIVDPGTKATSVRLVAENPRGLLKRDQLVRIAIHSARAMEGILVPAASVLRDDDNLPFVLIAGADGSFLRRRVTLGHRVGDRYEIATGLTPGEKIVGDGALFVQFAESQ